MNSRFGNKDCKHSGRLNLSKLGFAASCQALRILGFGIGMRIEDINFENFMTIGHCHNHNRSF